MLITCTKLGYTVSLYTVLAYGVPQDFSNVKMCRGSKNVERHCSCLHAS